MRMNHTDVIIMKCPMLLKMFILARFSYELHTEVVLKKKIELFFIHEMIFKNTLEEFKYENESC